MKSLAVFRFSSGYDGINGVKIHQKRNTSVEGSDVYHFTVTMILIQALLFEVVKFCELSLYLQNKFPAISFFLERYIGHAPISFNI